MKTTVRTTKDSRPSQNTLLTEAYIRSLMRKVNVVNVIGPGVCAILFLFYKYASSLPVDPSAGVNQAIGQGVGVLLLLLVGFAAWLITGWVYLVKISTALHRLPRERSSTMKDVVRHLHPTIYFFGVASLFAVFSLLGGFQLFSSGALVF